MSKSNGSGKDNHGERSHSNHHHHLLPDANDNADIPADGKGSNDDANLNANQDAAVINRSGRRRHHHGRRRKTASTNNQRSANRAAATTTTTTATTTSNTSTMTDDEWREELTMRKILEERARCFRPNEQQDDDETLPPPSPPLPPLLGGLPSLPPTSTQSEEEEIPPPTRPLVAEVTTSQVILKDDSSRSSSNCSKAGKTIRSCPRVVKAEMEDLEHGPMGDDHNEKSHHVMAVPAQPGAFAVGPQPPQQLEANSNGSFSWDHYNEVDEEVDVDAMIVVMMAEDTQSTTTRSTTRAVSGDEEDQAPALDAVLVTEDQTEIAQRSQPHHHPQPQGEPSAQPHGCVAKGGIDSLSTISLNEFIDSLPVFDGKIDDEDDPHHTSKYFLSNKVLALLAFLLLVVAILLALGLSGVLGLDPDNLPLRESSSSNHHQLPLPSPTLQRIQGTGILRCTHKDRTVQSNATTLNYELVSTASKCHCLQQSFHLPLFLHPC